MSAMSVEYQYLLDELKNRKLVPPPTKEHMSVKIDLKGCLLMPYLKDDCPCWQCVFCGAVNMVNDAIAVCHTCRELGCPQCMVQIGLHFEHMEME